MEFHPSGFHPKGFHPNISPIFVIKKGAFGRTYFRDIYSNITNKFYKNSWKGNSKNSNNLKN